MAIVDFFEKVRSKLNVKKGKRLTSFFKVLLISAFSLSCILLGAYLNKTGFTGALKQCLRIVLKSDYSFIQKYAAGKEMVIDQFDINLKLKNFEKIKYWREQAIINGGLSPDLEKEVSATMRYNNQDFKIDVSLTGQTVEHVIDPEKWSLAIKVKDGKTIMGMRTFAILVPMARGGLTDWIAIKLLESRNVIGPRGNFINLNINGTGKGLYYIEERFDKLLLENNHYKEGIVFNASKLDVEVYGLKKISQNKELASQLVRLKQLWYGFLNNDIEVGALFDLQKFASLFVVSDLMNQKHALFLSNTRLYFNPITSLIEPIGREWGDLGVGKQPEMSLSIERPNPKVFYHIQLSEDFVLKKIINSIDFKEEYIKEAVILSSPQYLDSIIEFNKIEKESLLNKLYNENPFYKFPIDPLHENQKYIRKKLLSLQPSIMVYFNAKHSDTIALYIKNMTDLPVVISGILYNNKKTIFSEQIIVKPDFEALDTFQQINLILDKETNYSQFSSDSVEVLYNLLGIANCQKTSVFPQKMLPVDFSRLNPTQQDPNYTEFSFLKIDEKNKQIKFFEKVCKVKKDIIIPKGYTITATPGCKINLCNSARIISYSPVLFFGKSDSVITITSSDSTGQGIIVYSSNRTSEFSHVNFEFLANPIDFGWSLSASITMYESPVEINNCSFNRNFRGDDYLNIIRAEFHIQNTTFQNTNADALDCDFSRGTINNVNFTQIRGDAIDVSGTQLKISNVNIINVGDKGISTGEGSALIGDNVSIKSCEIAVASKDNSTVEINKINISKCNVAYCAFQKKSEFGPGLIFANESKVENVKMDYLIEEGSMLTLNGKLIKGKYKNVYSMLLAKGR